MHPHSRLGVGLIVAFQVASCGGERQPAADAGSPARDAAAAADSGTALDAGLREDAASAVDASGGLDASSDVDAGSTAMPGPDVAGPYGVTTSAAMVSGATARAFVPDLPPGARAPLVIMKHGFQLATSNYAMLCERVASHGFVVVGVDTGGSILGGPTNTEERDAAIAAIDWATSAAPFAGRVDGDHVAVMGHSRGGKVAIMVAAADARISAALLLDPVNGCGPGASYSASCPDVLSAAIAGALRIPVGVMGETNNATGGFMPCAPSDVNYATIYAAITMSSWAVEWTFTGADHMDFTDDGGGFAGSLCTDGPGDDAQIRSAVRTMAVAFARLHLRGDDAMAAWLTGASIPSGVTHEGP